MAQTLTIHVIHSKKSVTFAQGESLTIEHSGTTAVGVPYNQVLWANFDRDTRVFGLTYLMRKKKKGPFSLIQTSGHIWNISDEAASEWVEALMRVCYEGSGIKRKRRLKVLVNPHGGVRKGVAVFVKTVEPILRAAHCSLDVVYTKYNGHAYDIAKDITLGYDAVVTVSGDGLVHEVMNGFANHEEPRRAFAIPIAPVPTGSGNGLALNLLGIEKGFDVTEAALNVIKGSPMKVDAFSLTQNGKRTISFMSQALGLMADLDIGTEHLRWMGDTRFMIGLIKGVIQFKPCPVQISMKVAEQDKEKMIEMLRVHRCGSPPSVVTSILDTSGSDITNGLPPLAHSYEDHEGWTTFPDPVLFVYAGKGPYVGRDFMAFPVSVPNDGLIDVMAMRVSSRSDILSSLGGAAKGENYWHPKLHYVKAHAYRVKPLATKGCLAIDGEAFPFEEYQVEVHKELATLLSPLGHYAAEFSCQPPSALLPPRKAGSIN